MLTNDLNVVRKHFDFTLDQVWLTLKMSGAYLGNVNGSIWTLIVEWWLYFIGLFGFILFSKFRIGIKLIALILLYKCVEHIMLFDSIFYLLVWVISGIF